MRSVSAERLPKLNVNFWNFECLFRKFNLLPDCFLNFEFSASYTVIINKLVHITFDCNINTKMSKNSFRLPIQKHEARYCVGR